jgi:hypothetical protein
MFIVKDAKTGKVLAENKCTPMLIETGRGEAWPYFGFWRLRDDKFDAENKPADVPYTRVYIQHVEEKWPWED